ncbi:hypothetical protein KF840_08760 [bacterium]|nr:hypothetical protein [bacterium]
MAPGQQPPADGRFLCGIHELLAHAAPYVPDGLIDPAAWRRLATLPGQFPSAGVVGAFECRLEAGASQIDFEVCITRDSGGQEALAAALPELAKRIGDDDPRWVRTVEFLRDWADPHSTVAQAAPIIWLELDLDAARDRAPGPFAIATLDPARAFDDDPETESERARAIQDVVAALHGGPLTPGTQRAFDDCLAALPPAGRLMHVAVRPGDGDSAVRIILQMPWPKMVEYLERVGWPGDRAELAAWLEGTCRGTRLHSLNLDLTDRVGPRIGVEYHHGTATPEWAFLLDALEERGACAPERRAQLAAWPSAGAASDALVRVERELLIKAVFAPEAPLRAKAYLAFTPRLNVAALFAARDAAAPALTGSSSVRART